MSTPRVSAVIRSKDRAHTIGRAIESVQKQTVATETIVVDSGSSDGTVSLAASLGAKVIQINQSDFTYGRSINIGMNAASGEFVLILSAHCALPDPYWLEHALTYFADRHIAALNGYTSAARPARSAHKYSSDLRGLESATATGTVRQQHPWSSFAGFSNHASLVRREAALEYPFNEQLTACEDKDWANRVAESGGVILYVEGLAVPGTHRRKEGVRALYRRARKEASAMKEIHRSSGLTSARIARSVVNTFRDRRGVKRLAPFRFSNLVETVGRLAGVETNGAVVPNRRDGTQETLDLVIRDLRLDRASRIHLLNFPLHDNSGDSAILLGTLDIIRAYAPRARVRHIANVLGPIQTPRRGELVLVRGGGYFNNLWANEMQAFLDACRLYIGSRIILMPQSLGELSTQNLAQLRRAIDDHGDVTLLLRDQDSFATASKHLGTAQIRLSPDAAHYLNPSTLSSLCPRRSVREGRVRVVARQDAEGDSSLRVAALDAGHSTLDFVATGKPSATRAFRWMHERLHKRLPVALSGPLLTFVLPSTPVYPWHARQELRRALAILAGTELIVTDRLHAAILASRMGIDVIAVDTGYGKLSRYFATWPDRHVTLVDNAENALAFASRGAQS